MSGGIPKNQITSRNTIEQQQHEEQAKAKRVLLVDEDGNPITIDNPLPTNATAVIGTAVRVTGTENGKATGTDFIFVNNLRLQILAAKDREQYITYADFGTKNQRVIRIDYTAPSIGTGPGYTARKDLSYVLDNNRYRRTSIIWSLV